MHIHSCYIVVFIVNSEYSVQPGPNKDLQETITVPGIYNVATIDWTVIKAGSIVLLGLLKTTSQPSPCFETILYKVKGDIITVRWIDTYIDTNEVFFLKTSV